MPALAFLRCPVPCPACGTALHDEVWFQWGFCVGQSPRPETTYAVGDEIRWRKARDGSIPGSTYLYEDGALVGGNMGSPAHRDVLVRDWPQDVLRRVCPACGIAVDGVVVEIRGGRIAGCRAVRPGEMSDDAEVVAIRDDGSHEVLVSGDAAMAVKRD